MVAARAIGASTPLNVVPYVVAVSDGICMEVGPTDYLRHPRLLRAHLHISQLSTRAHRQLTEYT